jgi:membrane-associated phospholipid phosphatase
MSNRVKAKYLSVLTVFILGTYFLIQGIVSHQHELLTDLDGILPFMPDFVWIYHSLVPVIGATLFLLVNNRRNFFTTFWSCLGATFIIHLIYVIMPSFYPRPDLIPHNLSEQLLALTYEIDNGSNTFPSGHVCYSWLLFLGVRYSKDAKKTFGLRNLYLLWAIGVTLSTLTLKVHYVVDVFGGLALAFLMFYSIRYLFNKFDSYRDETDTIKQ